MSTKKQQAQSNKNNSSLAKASSIDLTKSLSTITTASLQVQKTFGDISTELITKTAELEAVEEAIRLKKEEMTALHGVDQVLLTLDEARAQHAKELEENAQELDGYFRAGEVRKQELEVERKREQENYDYQLAQRRKVENEAWNDQIRTRNNNERDRMEAFNKDIEQRENELKSKEQQYNDAILKAQMFDADVEKAVAKQVAIVTNVMKKDFEHEKQMTLITHQSALDKVSYDNKRMVETANNLEAQNKDLQGKLEAAYTKNTELARAAVEGAANTKQVADLQSLITNVGGNGQRPRS